MSVLLKNAMLTDYRQARKGDLLIEGDVIAGIGDEPFTAERVIDAAGLAVMPGFVDLHAHFRDPGLTHKEDIASGCRAAVHGGYTYVNLMPNTKPVCSDMAVVHAVRAKAEKAGLCGIHQTVSITKDFDGKTLSHLDALDDGVLWLTDDGFGVDDTGTMLAAMRLAKENGLGLMLHEEDSALSGTDMYLAEELQTFRDVELAVLTGCKVHFCHVSTIRAMDFILDGKARGGNITLEVSPHHLALSDTNGGKVNPPLRAEKHRQYLVNAVKSGQVDAIATDHAPHTAEEKAADANGFTGLDLSFATLNTTLVRPGHIDLSGLSRLLSHNPSKLMGLRGGLLERGLPADITVVDLSRRFIAGEGDIHSKSKNSPILGQELYGRVLYTIRGGRIVYEQAD